jgi:hypothetical protein
MPNSSEQNDLISPDQPPRINIGTRQLYAIPLYTLFILIAVAVITEPKFERMFKEMDIGTLSTTTMLFLMSINTIHAYPHIFMPLMFAAAWLFFGWGCQTRRRMIVCSWVTAIAAIGFLLWMCLAYFLPLMITMKAIGK